MRVFITGSTGLLGTALLHNMPKGITVGGSVNKNRFLPNIPSVHYEYMDITKPRVVKRVLTGFKPDVVIHTAGIGNVDYCEQHQDEAWEVNVEGTRNIANVAKQIGSTLLFTSTNSVFNGKNPPYHEESEPDPLEYYGETKVQTEEDLREMDVDHILIRLITMYGWNNPYERQNPVTWAIDKLKQNQELKMVTDVHNNFLKAESAAESIWKAVMNQHRGKFHLAGADIHNRYQLVRHVAKVFDLNHKLVTPVTLDYFPSHAPRPKNTTFKINKMKKVLGVIPVKLKEGLVHMRDNPPREDHWIMV